MIVEIKTATYDVRKCDLFCKLFVRTEFEQNDTKVRVTHVFTYSPTPGHVLSQASDPPVSV